ncbi:hypothetical protein BDP55DRAFT_625154 [Colletotrichum godetiae]|uniref:Uncharacterized protein n=1 Tax=Colletotrichum godetiae TaxID=1209918 RepID=A0AAJ0AYY6_9PEZI|nr:uncharacterized protein BDP55DRAFT_625154 [Colletotrichum godetiae]KAK1700886.1 hypothetical protein BDP55DRAFT_625154 [Colletotrichum godetiae]
MSQYHGVKPHRNQCCHLQYDLEHSFPNCPPDTTSAIMHLAAVSTLFVLAGVAMAGNPRYKVSCDPAVPAAYQASMKAFEKKNCGQSEYFGRPGTWHEDTQSCEAPGPEGTNTERYYHPLFASSSGGPNISPRCHWVLA